MSCTSFLGDSAGSSSPQRIGEDDGILGSLLCVARRADVLAAAAGRPISDRTLWLRAEFEIVGEVDAGDSVGGPSPEVTKLNRTDRRIVLAAR